MSCSYQSRNKCLTANPCFNCCLCCSINCSVRCEISERENIRKGLHLTTQFSKPCLKNFNYEYANKKGKYITLTRKQVLKAHAEAYTLFSERNTLFRKLEDNKKEIDFGVFVDLTQEDKDKLNAEIDKKTKEIKAFFVKLKRETKIPNKLKLDIAFIFLARCEDGEITLRID